MTLTCTYCQKVIKSGTSGSKDEMLQKLDVFLLNNRITQDEYNELIDLINTLTKNNTETETTDSSNAL